MIQHFLQEEYQKFNTKEIYKKGIRNIKKDKYK